MLDVKSGQEAPFLNLNLLDLGDVGVDSRDVRIKERAVSEFGFIPPAKYGRDSLATIALPANRPKIIGVEPPAFHQLFPFFFGDVHPRHARHGKAIAAKCRDQTVFYVVAQPFDGTSNRDDGSHSDNDPQEREHRAHLMGPDRVQGNAGRFPEKSASPGRERPLPAEARNRPEVRLQLRKDRAHKKAPSGDVSTGSLRRFLIRALLQFCSA